MGGQVEVGAVGDALKLAPLAAGEPVPVLDVHGALGVVRALLRRVLEQAQVLLLHAQAGVPALPRGDPVVVPFLVGAGLDEELHLHLLELAGAEDEVARGDLVAERLADLPDPERDLLPRGLQHVAEVDEDPLRGLRPQVGQARLVLGGAEVGAQQPVEHARLGERAPGAAVRAGDQGQALGRGVPVLLLVGLDEVVGTEPLVAGLAFGQRVHELGDVAAGLPDLAGEDHAGVEPDDVVAALDHRLPPLPLDVVLHLHAERAVVPGRAQPAVDLTGRVDETAPPAEADDRVDAVGTACHGDNSIRLAVGGHEGSR